MDTPVEGTAASELGRPLLLAKTMVPPVRPDTVNRPHLLAGLERAGTPITVVVAPAGWGKTTLLAQFAGAQSHPVGWLTLDATDDDHHRFWAYLIMSLRRAGANVGESALAALQVPGLDPVEIALPRLLNDLAETDQRCTVILDDFHLAADPLIGEELEYLIAYLPQGARVVVGSRIDPPLPLALWRGRGLLTEIRADHLRFGEDEAARLMASETSIRLDSRQSRELVERTEGWVAGLQLIAMAVRGASDPVGRLAGIGGDHGHLIDYVTSEVLSSFTDEQRDLLLRGSVLDRLSGSLCDIALDIEGSARILEDLARADPFVSRLDNGWYRVHAIVRDALRRRFTQDDEHGPEGVLRKAAGWYLERGDFEAGIRHLIEAGVHDEAALLLLEYENDFLDGGMIGSFLAMAESLGPAAVRSDPRLGVAMAWAAGVSGRGDRVDELLDRSESVMDGTEPAPHGWSSLAGSAAALRAMFGDRSSSDLHGANVHARRAVDLEQDPAFPGYSVARLALGLSFVGLDALDEALPHLTEAWERCDVAGMPAFTRLAIAGVLCTTLISRHRNEEARRVITAASPMAHQIEAALGEAAGPAIGALRYAEARLLMEENPGAEATERLSRAVDMVRLAGHPSQTVRALTMLGNVSLDSGDVEAARNALAEAREIVSSEPVFPAVLAYLEEANNRLGRAAVGTARRQRQLAEDLTDRELSILRSLQGPLNQREIARELYLSINTVKGYTKSLYRKLGVSSREEAVQQAMDLGLI